MFCPLSKPARFRLELEGDNEVEREAVFVQLWNINSVLSVEVKLVLQKFGSCTTWLSPPPRCVSHEGASGTVPLKGIVSWG